MLIALFPERLIPLVILAFLFPVVALAQGACFDERLDLRSPLFKPGRIVECLLIARSFLAQDAFVLGRDLFAQSEEDTLERARKAESLRDAGPCFVQETFLQRLEDGQFLCG